MWKDFIEAFGYKIKGGRFEQVLFYVSELQTWILWHQRQSLQFMIYSFVTGILVGGIFSSIVIFLQLK